MSNRTDVFGQPVTTTAQTVKKIGAFRIPGQVVELIGIGK